MMDSAFKKCDMNAVIKLNSKLKKGLLECSRAECAYEQALEDAFYIEDLKNNQQNPEWKIKSALRNPREGQFGPTLDTLDWIYQIKLKPILCALLGLAATILSFMIIIGELAILFDAKTNLF